MSPHNHSEMMRRALALWQNITGVDPNATNLLFGEMDVRSTFGLLREAIDLDPTEVTAMLLFEPFQRPAHAVNPRRIPLSKHAMNQIEKSSGDVFPDIPNIVKSSVWEMKSAVEAAAE